MADCLALEHLYTSVVSRFASEASGVQHYFGWRKPAQQLPTNRLVWVPGDDANASVGAILPARSPGQNPRPLATLDELFTVYVIASDAVRPEDELAQYKAARLLFDAWYRAVHLAAYGAFRIISSAWVDDAKERRWGAAIRVVAAVQALIPDDAKSTMPTDTTAEIDVEELDVTETVTTPAP